MGFFDSEIGNAVPLAMTEVLGIPIIIISSTLGYPIVHLRPQQSNVHSNTAIYLAYNQCGKGHYEMAEFSSDRSSKSDKETFHCRCGVNRKGSEPACIDSDRYKSRCKCYNHKKACSSACSCKGCKNPIGLRPLTPVKRKRHRHELQTEIPSPKRFLAERGTLPQGPWSQFETIVFANVLNVLKSLFIEETSNNIVEAYNEVVAYSNSSVCSTTLPPSCILKHKTYNQIIGKYSHYLTEVKLYKQII